MYLDTDSGMESTLETRTALVAECNAWRTYSVLGVRRRSCSVRPVLTPTMIPVKMCPFVAMQVRCRNISNTNNRHFYCA